jgi:hypothetical protein
MTMNDGNVRTFALPGTLSNEDIAMATGDLVKQLGDVAQAEAFTPGSPSHPIEQGFIEGITSREGVPELGQPGRLGDVVAAQVPESTAGFIRGAVDRFVESPARLAGLISGGAVGTEPGGKLQTAGDLLTAGFNVTPAGLALSGGGTATQGLAEVLGADPHTGRLLSMAFEMATGLRGVFKAGRAAEKAKPGVKLVEEGITSAEKARKVAPTGVPKLTPKEVVGNDLRNLVLDTIDASAKRHGAALESAENAIMLGRRRIMPTDPDFEDMQMIVSKALSDDIVSLLPGDAKKIVAKWDRAMGHTKVDPITKKLIPDPLPLEMRDLVQLRRVMGRRLTTASPLDSGATKLARGFRHEITNAIERGAATQGQKAMFAKARELYRRDVFNPRDTLKRLIRNETTPQQAFDIVFDAGDPDSFRAVHGVINQIPGVRDKLRLGFVESLGDLTGSAANVQAAQAAFQRVQPALASTGLYSVPELREIGRALKHHSIPNMVERLSGGVTRLAEKGGPGNALLGTLAILNPKALFSVVVAASGVGLLRKLTLSTAGSPRERQLAGALLARVTTMAGNMSNVERANKEAIDAPDTDSMSDPGRGVLLD